ncbi:MAG: MBL fold metallo-hydrolase [Bacteroidales bacterium]|nr:MBL fold metallo-hydrolase [Bacteroidales bacterium]
MKRPYMLIIAAAIIFSGCHNKLKSELVVAEPQKTQDTSYDCIYQFNFDGVELWTLKDKVNTMPAALFPDADAKIVKELMPNGEADAGINVFLVKHNGQYILFDAGLGVEKGGEMMRLLQALNIQSSDISAVCITHFHGDHIGGMLTNGEASFPKATVYCSAEEVKAWKTDKGVQKMLAAYEGRVQTFHGGETILGDIVTKAAPGHTPGHTLYQVGSVLIIGDLLHAAALQLPHPEFSAKYDQDQKMSVKTRQEYYQYIKDNHLVVAGMHLPSSGVMEDFPTK